ncbi:MAG: dTDP-4-dehydrorhamnose reductase [Desulfobulbaceae bacterium]|nr:dTDP-4-dehydrorhamnose reductase [Desulfobulbaceae bacterium]
MKVLIAGGNGQLGWELQRSAPSCWQVTALKRDVFDICNIQSLEKAIKEYQPNLLINAAAYTAVDKAEEQSEQAFAVNAEGAANLARIALEHHVRLFHISTDFIFDGRKSRPYLPTDKPSPLGVYGTSKLEGEQQVQKILGNKSVIIRTSWVYSSHGNNFVKTMLRLMQERDQLSIICDQIGTPTWAGSLTDALWAFAVDPLLSGIYHWTDAGVASWYDFGVAIYEEARRIGLLDKVVTILPIRTEDYPLPAKRPPYSVLDKTSTWQALNLASSHWRVNLRQMLLEVKREG